MLQLAFDKASHPQDSNAASDARQNRSLRHASDVAQSINGGLRRRLSTVLFAFAFGIVSMLLTSTGRSQTVEELQQQIEQLQSVISGYQSEISGYQSEISDLQSQITDFQAQKDGLEAANDTSARQKAQLECDLFLLDEQFVQLSSQMSANMLVAQFAERNQIDTDINNYLQQLAALVEQLANLDPNSETYDADSAAIVGQMFGIALDNAARSGMLADLDDEYLRAQMGDAVLQAQLDTIPATRAALLQQIDAIQSNIDSNNSTIQEIDAQIGSLQGQINDLQNQINGLQSQIDTLQSQIDALQNQINELNNM